MHFEEDDFVMISALQHYVFCPRQCALIHIEQVWTESRLTAEGRLMHERVHEEGNESRGSVRITRGLPLRSARLGLVGVADVVEFHRQDKGIWHPFPVEYKRGKPKPDHSDTIQLCAQALCLEEMLSVSVPTGALFYGQTRRRLDVSFTDVLRNETERAAEEAHRIINSGMTPAPVYGKRCKNCSLVGQCLPNRTGKESSVRRYLERMVKEL
jgi:CRISPR-associated exonuclease Cas4